MTVATSLVAEQTHVDLEGSGFYPGQSKSMLGQGLPDGFYQHFSIVGIEVFIQSLRVLHGKSFFYFLEACSKEAVILLLRPSLHPNFLVSRLKAQSLTVEKMWKKCTSKSYPIQN